MTATLAATIGVIALCAVFDYTNGFHDSANSVATVIATGVLKPRAAVAWAAAWNFVAFMVFGTAVANTVATVVKEGDISLALIFAAVAGATIWNLLSWHFGLPTSSSHALVGGLVGAGLVAGGWDAISLSAVRKVAIFIVVSPLVGMLLAIVLMATLRLATGGGDGPRVQSFFRRGQLFSSAALSLGHGGNDAQKTMGVVAAVLITTGHLQGGSDIDIPLWVVLLAHGAIAAGTYAGGWRIVHTMGGRITELRPLSGFAAESSAAIALFGSTAVGAPVSTTQTVAGGIGGAGIANPASEVDWRVFGHLVSAWVITLPLAALISAGTFVVTVHLPPVVAGIAITFGFLVAGWLTFRSMRSAPGADDISALVVAEDEDEDQVTTTPSSPSSAAG